MKHKTIAIVLIVAAVVAAAGTAALALVVATARTIGTEPLHLYVDSSTTTANLEEQCGPALHDPGLFRLVARLYKLDPSARPGHYLAEPGTRYLDLVRQIRAGRQTPVRLTIGKFRLPQQLNEYLNSKLMHDDFDVPLDSFHIIRPDTYEFYWTVSPEAFMQRMEREWNAEGERLKVKGETSDTSNLSPFTSHLSPKEVVILASIVEEETNNNAEKPLIASVYLNRLAKGMPLQADPTVKYAVGDFTLRRILNKHLAIESPFNTYLHTGLPPAPICLPSKASVGAVLNAPRTRYLYFCASPELDGTHRFAATLAEHNRNAAAFHRAINARGIK